MADLHLYRLDDGEERYWIAAATPEEALSDARERYEVGADDEGPVDAQQVPDDEELGISFPDDPPEPADIPPGGRLQGDGIIATASQWATHVGAGVMVGSTLY